MASSKRIGFYWGEDRVTIVEFDKNAPQQVVSTSIESKAATTSSPFSSNFSEEIQMTALVQKMLQDHRITDADFYVSLPMKEIILRSFVIPFVKTEDIPNAVRFEAKKYLPIDIQELTFVFYTTAFTENKVKRLQVVFFAVRKETLGRYERIFKQVNAEAFYGEPCVVSLTKVLLFKKEVKPTDHLAFLTLDKNSGSICFIDKGLPQFIREFSINSLSAPGEVKDSAENFNLKIVNEVGNSFDFYARQFGGEKMEQMLVSSEGASESLLDVLESELKIKIRKVSPVVSMGTIGQSNDMDSIYAMGACVAPPISSLSGFNFLESKVQKPKISGDIFGSLQIYKDVIVVLVICVASLFGVNAFFQTQLNATQHQYNQLSMSVGTYLTASSDSIKQEMNENIDKLAAYKNIPVKTDMSLILLRVASHLPKGTSLRQLDIRYVTPDANSKSVNLIMLGESTSDDPNKNIAVVNQISSDLKNDKELSPYIKNSNLVSINIEKRGTGQVTTFTIHCS